VDGKEKALSASTFTFNPFDVFLWTDATGQFERLGLDGDGTFVWTLKPGDYTIAGFQAYAPLRLGRIWARFSAPGPGLATYVGALRIEVFEGGHYRFDIEDHFDDVMTGLRSKPLPTSLPAGVEPTKALMVAEPTPGHVAGVWSICSKRSGLNCDRSHQGVTATSPSGTENGFPTVASLAPLLEWNPVLDLGMTYDVAVYESLVINPMPGFTRALRGPLVAYAEGLTESHYQVASPLRPDRKYEWSVRLRDGDSVSTWSTTGYFYTIIIATTSGSGKWFGLTTPKQQGSR